VLKKNQANNKKLKMTKTPVTQLRLIAHNQWEH